MIYRCDLCVLSISLLCYIIHNEMSVRQSLYSNKLEIWREGGGRGEGVREEGRGEGEGGRGEGGRGEGA